MIEGEPRISLQPYPDDKSRLDDVFVSEVQMFRSEMMNSDFLWLACYLPGTGVERDRVTFAVRIVDGELRLEVEEYPEGAVRLDAEHGG